MDIKSDHFWRGRFTTTTIYVWAKQSSSQQHMIIVRVCLVIMLVGYDMVILT
jgi:hypothetical protein